MNIDKELAHSSFVIKTLTVFVLAAITWSAYYEIDQTTRATAKVIATSQVQIIQSASGGVIDELHVREGDRVVVGQKLATLDRTKFLAAVNEVKARIANLEAVSSRLKAELLGRNEIIFTELSESYPEVIELQVGLFNQRLKGFLAETRNLERSHKLAIEEANIVRDLVANNDVNRKELISVQRAENEAESNLINLKNRYFEDVSTELAKVEDEIRQNREVLVQRVNELDNSTFISRVPGIVKNVRTTTVGAVIRTGEEIMQIIPTDEDLILEAKISPSEIVGVREGLEASIRFDAFDYTIHGVAFGLVSYISADTLVEDTKNGEMTYYKANVTLAGSPVVTNNGKLLDVIPGMTATVDVHTGKRSVLSYLLKPLRKTLDEAFTER